MHLPNITQLTQDCAEQSNIFKQTGVSDEQFCLELFRYAITKGMETAWEAVLKIYTSRVEQWVQNASGYATTPDDIHDLTSEAILRFWQNYDAELFYRATNLASILNYWKSCAKTVFYDWSRKRRTRKDIEVKNLEIKTADGVTDDSSETMAEPDERMLDTTYAQEDIRIQMLTVLDELCRSDKERLIAHRIFIEDFKPRDVYMENRAIFKDEVEVRQQLRNLKERLQRNSKFCDLLKQCLN